MTSSDLDTLRDTISSLDEALLKILSERRNVANAIVDYKMANQLPIRDLKREQLLLKRLFVEGEALGLDTHYIQRIFQIIIDDSVQLQQAKLLDPHLHTNIKEQIKVAYLGGQGSYSQLACQRYFQMQKSKVIELGESSFKGIVAKVEQGQADYGLLPIENTSSGAINEVYDAILHAHLHIVGEAYVPVEHCLLAPIGTKKEDIKSLFGHPQPFAQCSQYLEAHGQFDLNYCDSTTDAIKQCLKTPHSGAIGSAHAGRSSGLVVVDEHLANQSSNYSRFIVVARNPIDLPANIRAKTSLIMITQQHSGALADALMVFKEADVNLLKLTSRPMPNNPWEEVFYVDVAGHQKSKEVTNALNQLANVTQSIRILGSYAEAINE